MTSHAVNGWRALVFNKFYFLYDQVNFDNNIALTRVIKNTWKNQIIFYRNTGIIQDFPPKIAEPYSTASCTVTFPPVPMYNPQISAVSRMWPNEWFKLLSYWSKVSILYNSDRSEVEVCFTSCDRNASFHCIIFFKFLNHFFFYFNENTNVHKTNEMKVLA